MLIILFGLAGAGKSYIGNTMQKVLKIPFYDGDVDVPLRMKAALANKQKITTTMRDEFFEILFKNVEKELQKQPTLIVSQTFLKDKYRKQAMERFSNVVFVLVQAFPKVREQRLARRATLIPVSGHYAKNMDRRFQQPTVPYLLITNNKEGDSEIILQIEALKKQVLY